MTRKAVVGAIAVAFAFASAALAQNFLTRQMMMIVPFAAGGPQDGIGRISRSIPEGRDREVGGAD
jgi:tripartite-type tricarboxylate transporter receptor subunit TctC